MVFGTVANQSAVGSFAQMRVAVAKPKLAGFGVDVNDPIQMDGFTHSSHLRKYFKMSADDFVQSFETKCHLKISAFARRMADLGVQSAMLTQPPSDRAPPIVFPENFDSEHYLLLYPNVAASTMTAAGHYMMFGGAEGRRCPTR